jgi:hypothetical protein
MSSQVLISQNEISLKEDEIITQIEEIDEGESPPCHPSYHHAHPTLTYRLVVRSQYRWKSRSLPLKLLRDAP